MDTIERITKSFIPTARVEGGENVAYIHYQDRFIVVPLSIHPYDLQNRLTNWLMNLDQEYI